MLDTSRIPDAQTADEAAWALACQREVVIRPLLDLRPLPLPRVEAAARALGVSRSLIHRLVARYRGRAQTSSLLPRTRGRTRHLRMLDPPREAIIATAIDRRSHRRQQKQECGSDPCQDEWAQRCAIRHRLLGG
jgi:hypothetical protein